MAREARTPSAASADAGGGGGEASAEVVRAAVAALPGRLLKQLPGLLGQAGLSATAAGRVAACLRHLVAIAPGHQQLLLAELEAELRRCALGAGSVNLLFTGKLGTIKKAV